jgi:predicted PolB exonuclease-like 3'-5' exonuclease
MYIKSNLLDYIYFDIETKPKYKNFDEMPAGLQKIWLDKHHIKAFERELESQKKKELTKKATGKTVTNQGVDIIPPTVNDIYIKEAGLHAEFAEILCISFGVFDKNFKKTINTIQNESEKVMIEQFIEVLHHFYYLNLFGFNIDEFDIPFFLKRMWLNGIVSNYPPQLQLQDAKPWTVKHIDHMKSYKGLSWMPITLDLMCEVLGIPTSKDEFSNSEFTTLFNQGKITIADAIRYCEKDVVATMDVALKFASDNSNYAIEPKWKTTKAKSKTTVDESA